VVGRRASATRVTGQQTSSTLVVAQIALSVVLLARWLSRYMESVLLEVGATDAAGFAGTAVAVLLVALAAACAPVVQAVRVDPVKSLRV
jgi:hypothetical protein